MKAFTAIALFICLFSGYFIHDVPAQPIPGSYESGKRELQAGKYILEEEPNVKKRLDNLFKRERITVEMLMEILRNKDLELADFFSAFEETTGVSKQLLEEIRRQFREAMGRLQQATVYLDDTTFTYSVFADAYLRKAEAYIEMNRKQEAIDAFEEARRIGFDRLVDVNLLDGGIIKIEESSRRLSSLIDITYTIADLYMQKISTLTDETSGEDTSAVRSIEDLRQLIGEIVQAREARLKEILQTEPDNDRIKNQLLLNRLELAAFFLKKDMDTQARLEYQTQISSPLEKEDPTWTVNDELNSDPALYEDAQRKLDALNNEIAHQERNFAHISIEKPLATHLRIFNKDKIATSADLVFTQSGGGQIMVGTANLVNYDKLALSDGGYVCVINFPEVKVIKPNLLPTKVTLKNRSRGTEEYVLTEQVDGRDIQIIFSPLEEGESISLLQNQYTLDYEKRVITSEQHEIPQGNYSASVRFQYDFTKGEEYRIEIEYIVIEKPPPWWVLIVGLLFSGTTFGLSR